MYPYYSLKLLWIRLIETLIYYRKHGPRVRTRQYLINKGYWSEAEDKALDKEKKKEVLKALETSGKKEKHGLDSLFDDVYDEIPKHLQEQYDSLKKHMEKYPNEYTLPSGH